jgi:hypothetical protein
MAATCWVITGETGDGYGHGETHVVAVYLDKESAEAAVIALDLETVRIQAPRVDNSPWFEAKPRHADEHAGYNTFYSVVEIPIGLVIVPGGDRS